MRPSPTVAAACTLLLASLAQAQDAPPGGADAQPRAGAKLERVEITRPNSDTDLRRRAPVAKQIYGREEIDQFGDSNVADVLKRLPGVSVAGGAPRMRGLGAGYTLILINGDPAPPGFALDQLDPAQVERIEVTKGPTADQSAQAVAGAINIILKDAPRVAQRDLRLAVGYNAVRPTPAATLTLGEKVGDVSYSVPLSVFEWRQQGRFSNDRVDGQPSEVIQHGLQDNWGHGFNTAPRVNWRISDEESLALQGFVQKGFWRNRQTYQNELISGQPHVDDNALSRGDWQNLRGNVQWINRFSEAQRIELKLSVQDSKGTNDSKTFRLVAPASEAQVWRVNLGQSHDQSLIQAGKYGQLLGDEHSLTVGWDLEWRQRDETRSITENGQPQLPGIEGQPFGARIQRQALFAQDEWELSPQWSTYLGLRAERIQTESKSAAAAAGNTSLVVTPLWHLNYKLDPKGRDMIRASVTRSYKAPDLNALLARPSTNTLGNGQLTPDRVGNPLLKPELATGLDIAFEKYLAGGGMVSLGGFYRGISDLIRNVTTLETVAWAEAPRYVSRPVNFSKAQTMGLELELKGRAGELLPSLFDPKLALNLRGNISFYHSNVDALPVANNRLDGQQPWSANLGFDYRLSSLPLNMGVSLAYTPGYLTQQTLEQSLDISHSRALDMFAQWTLSKSMSLRVSASNLLPLDSHSMLVSGQAGGPISSLATERGSRTQFGAALEFKL